MTMTYKGVAKGKIIELEETLPYSEGQPVSVSIEPLRREAQPGSPPIILKTMRGLPRLNPEDVDELERTIEQGRLHDQFGPDDWRRDQENPSGGYRPVR
jgi:hypothetical protein